MLYDTICLKLKPVFRLFFFSFFFYFGFKCFYLPARHRLQCIRPWYLKQKAQKGYNIALRDTRQSLKRILLAGL